MHCSNCGTEVPEGAKFCSGCGGAIGGSSTKAPEGRPAKAAPSAKSIGCAAALVIVGMIIVVPMCSGPSPTQQAIENDVTPPLPVTATELFNAYQDNEAAAQARFGGRRLEVSGIVDGVDLDILNKPIVKLVTPNQFMSAQATLTEESASSASSLAKGQKIVLHCKSVGEVIGTPMLRDCSL